MARIGVVEDHGVVREGLCALLASWPEAEVVWTSGSGEEALEQAASDQPDLVLMDISLHGMSGIAATRALTSRYPELLVLMLTVHDTHQHIRAAHQAGAVGYVLKDAPADTLRSAMAQAVAGEPWVGAQVPTPGGRGDPGETTRAPKTPMVAELTERELQVLTWVGRGETSRQIAGRLGISPRTVEKHKANVMEKLGVHSSAGLAALAARRGLV